jgi:hypothetical protein
MKLHVPSAQYSGGNTQSKSPASRIPSPVDLSPLPLSPGKIPLSFRTDVSPSNGNNFFNSAGAVTCPQSQAPDEIGEPVNRDMQALRSWETRVLNCIENVCSDDDIHSSEMQDVITAGPIKRKNPSGESKDIHRPTSEDSKSFSEVFRAMLKFQIGMQHIRFPKGLEDDMTGRVVNLAEKAFSIYTGLHRPPRDP